MTSFQYYVASSLVQILTENQFFTPPVADGDPVLLQATSTGQLDAGIIINFDLSDTDRQPEIIIFNFFNDYFMHFDESDQIVKWRLGLNTDLEHRCAFVRTTGPHAGNPIAWNQLVIWTETPTRRYTWKRVGNQIQGFDDLPPATNMQILDDNQLVSFSQEGLFSFRVDTNQQQRTVSPMPFFSDLDMIDGAFIKMGTSTIFGLGYSEYQGTNASIPQLGFGFVDVAELPATSDGVWTFSDPQFWPVQLRRNRDIFGTPTGTWELWLGSDLGRICSTSDRPSGGRVTIFEKSGTDPDWDIKWFNWGFEFDAINQTIAIFNADMLDDGFLEIWMGQGTNDNLSPFQRIRTLAERKAYSCEFMFAPEAYEYRRYAREEELLVECCSSTVDEVGPNPIGYLGSGSDIKYEIFCPETHLPDPITSNIKTNASGVCDPLLVEWCGRPENELKSLCACINPFDAPPLPDDSLINAFKRCFSQQCRDFGYRTAGMIIPSTGQLDCPQELCTNIINIEEGSNVEFDEAKQIIDCTDDGGGGGTGGMDTMTLIYIIVGSILGLGLIIGVSVGISEGNKAREAEKKQDRKDAERKRQRELTQARIQQQQAQLQQQALARRIQQQRPAPPVAPQRSTQAASNQQLLEQIQALLNR